MMAALRRYLFAGIVALAPLLVTVVLIDWLLDISDRALALLPQEYHPAKLIGFEIPGIGVLLALLFILAVGAITSHVVGAWMMRLLAGIMERIPLIRAVYKGTRQLLESIFSDRSKTFQSVVMIQFPRPGNWMLGFVTGEASLAGVPGEAGADAVTVFVPSVPVPTTGWLFFVQPDELVQLDMSIEDGMRLVLSGGVLTPTSEGALPSGVGRK